ncbi:hypothetical protein MKZ38_005986 [Zalerion maritima]|uniref:Zn(2)-C6 fungal-type domain-containing protein n=1 Tax=Zalerion maritima TaxID=339359 RepID=A0AAD5RPN0_9PEZI|nr:hypothetical protein MKZ38_005986 [Zalerion maritima]
MVNAAVLPHRFEPENTETESMAPTPPTPTSGLGKAKLKRAKTGCLGCRTKRRKCDEGKPVCQRCLASGSKCEYAAKFVFLEKNNFTIGTGGVEPAGSSNPASASPSPDRYPQIPSSTPRAVSIGFETTSDFQSRETGSIGKSSIEPVHHPIGSTQKSTQHPNSGLIDAGEVPTERSPGPVFLPERGSRVFHPEPARSGSLGSNPSHTPECDPFITSVPAGTPATDGFKIALDALLSLGTNPNFASPADSCDVITPGLTPGSSSSAHGGRRNANLRKELREVNLLRMYRYYIAPWLDICDLGQTFGVVVARTALSCLSVASSLFELSSLCAGQPVAHLLGSSPWDWSRDESWNSCGPWETQESMASFWLLLRQNLCVTILKTGRIFVPPDTEIPWPNPGREDDLFRKSQEAVVLCAEAIGLASRGSPSQSPMASPGPYSGDLRERWERLAALLEKWYRDRICELLPVFDQDMGGRSNSLFPTIVLTNGASAMANQLYHTAMMFMLLTKPRTLRLAPASPLTHAQRVCGIALHNDRRECWDINTLYSTGLCI